MKKLTRFSKHFIVIIILVFCHFFCWSQPGSLDPVFNGGGILFSGNYEKGNTIAVQSDGKIIVAGGNNDFTMTRYNIDATIDNSFGSSGVVVTDFGLNEETVEAIILQQDGKIIAAGYSMTMYSNAGSLAIARYHSNGNLDNSFDNDGKLTINTSSVKEKINDIALQNDGKIIMVGHRYLNSLGNEEGFLMLRLNSNGSVDNSFDSDGIVSTEFGEKAAAFGVAINNANGKIIVVGYSSSHYQGFNSDSMAIACYNPNGSLDNSFSGDGKLTMLVTGIGAVARTVLVQPDGKLVVGGSSWTLQSHGEWWQGEFAVLRFTSSGALDNSFDFDGINTLAIGLGKSLGYKLALQSNGKIILGGTSTDIDGIQTNFSLARFNSNGSLDNSFGTGGKVSLYFPSSSFNYAYSLALSNNRIYLAGNSSSGFLTAAFKNDGTAYSPYTINLCPSVASTNISFYLSGSAFQWQLSTDGIVFTDIANNSNYSGVNTSSLSLINIPSAWYGYQYRCVLSNGISQTFTIRFSNTWIGNVGNAWADSGNWSCGALPDSNTDVVINSGFYIVISASTTIRSLVIHSGTTLILNTGVTLNITH